VNTSFVKAAEFNTGEGDKNEDDDRREF